MGDEAIHEPNYFESNAEETIAVVGHSLGKDTILGIYDGVNDEGIMITSVEDARWVRDAIDRWLSDGGRNG